MAEASGSACARAASAPAGSSRLPRRASRRAPSRAAPSEAASRRAAPARALPPGAEPGSIVLTFPVAREFAGQRLDVFLQGRITRLSRTRAAAIVRACAYREDGARRRPSERVREGEVVILVRDRMVEPDDVPLEFRVLHEDDALLAIDKPAGLPMHPTATYHKRTLTWLLRERYGDDPPHIAHRLDRETSGVVLCGKHLQAERRLKIAFERREVDKAYIAIVRGEVAADQGEIDLPMDRVREGLHVMMEARADGLPAKTRFRVERRCSGYSLLALEPETGRQHQLRVHLAAVGHPIVGDKLYGPEREAPFLDFIETGMTPELEERLGHRRQALHAHRVDFDHPQTGARFQVTSPFAPDLEALWARLAAPAHQASCVAGDRDPG